MIAFTQKDSYTAEDLLEIIGILRNREYGCPWDKVQTHRSIRMNFLEEVYEAVDAIDLNDPELLCEELGDVLMQVAFHTCMEAETGTFGWPQVCDGVCRKLILRHPHIFGAQPGMEGINDWDVLKNREKGRQTLAQDLESVPNALPALMRADKLQKRAARYERAPLPSGTAQAVAEAAEALEEAEAGSPTAQAAAGRLLFEVVALSRKAKINPEEALQTQNKVFAAQT